MTVHTFQVRLLRPHPQSAASVAIACIRRSFGYCGGKYTYVTARPSIIVEQKCVTAFANCHSRK